MEIFDLSIITKVTKGVKKVHFKAESEGVNEELNAIYSVIEKTPGLKAPVIVISRN